MPKPRKPRKSLSLRLQPNEGTPLALVADYLNDLDKDEFRRKVGEALVAFFYPYASKEICDSEVDSLRDAFLVSRDIASKHFGIMALALCLDAIVVAPVVNPGISGTTWEGERSQENNHSKSLNVSEEFDESEDLIESKAKPSDVSKLFDF